MARKPKINEEDLKEKKARFEKVADNLEVVSAEDFLKNNFLPYSWSYNLDRALVDVSGLKPVHRRVLYTLFKDGLTPNSHHAVVATVAGRVLAFHPHGNVSVEDAIKNMGREHVFRVPLVDGSGDFGSPGSPGAAGRYIKARLSKAGWLNVEEIAEKAVSMVPNYDDTQDEPVKIPVKWPVAVVNGGAGIAIGYASNMPSHNPTEVMTACKALVEDPELSSEQLMKYIKGPDFNMGGTITSNDGIKDYLTTGSGSFKVRGSYEIKPGPRGTSRIEFYEIPFGTDPEAIVAKIQEAIGRGKLQEVANYKNLSDLTHPIRVVIDTKPSSNSKKVLQELFKETPLEVSFSANMTTIVDNQPKQSSIQEMLLDFIFFRKQCIANKSRYALGRKNDRLHLVEGLLKTLLNIDKAIAIIRQAENSDEASKGLQEAFSLDEKQAEHVLSLQLRRLTKLDKLELDQEKTSLEEEIAYLTSLLNEEEVLRAHLIKEFDATIKVIGDERKTEIISGTTEEFIAQEREMVRELKKDTKNLPCFVYRLASGHLIKSYEPLAPAVTNGRTLEHAPVVEVLKMKTQDSLVLVDSSGKGFTIPLSYLPLDAPSLSDSLGVTLTPGSSLVALGKVTTLKTEVGLLLASKLGEVKVVKPELPEKEGFTVFNLQEGDSLIYGRWLGRTLSKSYYVSLTSGNNALVYDATTVRPTGLSAGGVKSQKLKEGETVIAFGWVSATAVNDTMILSRSDGAMKLTPFRSLPPKGKGSQGVALHKFRKDESKLVQACVGTNPVAVLEGTKNVVSLPPATPRATVGVPCNFPLWLGESMGEATDTSL